MRIAFLHLAPVPGALDQNRRLVERSVNTAAHAGATWILTPEFATCGYGFCHDIGTEWIAPQPDVWMAEMSDLAARLRVILFLSHPERDPHSGKLHNTVFVISDEGTIVGKHRKVNTLRTGSEAWSSPGEHVEPVLIDGFGRVGVLICADACSPEIATRLNAQGAQLLISAAAWPPGFHGPAGEWERCTRDTGLPLFVCNRTGPDRTLNFTEGESVVAKDGTRLLSLSSDRSVVFLIDWNEQQQAVESCRRINPDAVDTI